MACAADIGHPPVHHDEGLHCPDSCRNLAQMDQVSGWD